MRLRRRTCIDGHQDKAYGTLVFAVLFRFKGPANPIEALLYTAHIDVDRGVLMLSAIPSGMIRWKDPMR